MCLLWQLCGVDHRVHPPTTQSSGFVCILLRTPFFRPTHASTDQNAPSKPSEKAHHEHLHAWIHRCLHTTHRSWKCTVSCLPEDQTKLPHSDRAGSLASTEVYKIHLFPQSLTILLWLVLFVSAHNVLTGCFHAFLMHYLVCYLTISGCSHNAACAAPLEI